MSWIKSRTWVFESAFSITPVFVFPDFPFFTKDCFNELLTNPEKLVQCYNHTRSGC